MPLESKVKGGSDDVYIRGVYMSVCRYIDEAVRCVLGHSTSSVAQAIPQIKVSILLVFSCNICCLCILYVVYI